RDTHDLKDVRLAAYSAAWKRCFDRIHEIIGTLYHPVGESIVKEVGNVYADNEVLPGLPHAEIPVIAISATDAGSSFFNDIANRLEGDDNPEDEESRVTETRVTHLHPSDCSTLMSAMKTLVMGFVDKPPDGETTIKRKPTASLASYDIELLKVWYRALKECTREDRPSPQLAVMMHDFEQFDDAVVRDLFYICSLHVPEVPLLFLLSLSSPPAPSYLHTTYPRSMLSLMRLQIFSLPSGIEILEKLVEETFFDLAFEPDVMVGPTTLEYLIDFFTRHTSSVDGFTTVLQLAHMKHFEDPLAVFTHREHSLAEEILGQPEAFGFLDTLLSRCLPSSQPSDNLKTARPRPIQHKGNPPNGNRQPPSDIPSLLSTVRNAHDDFRTLVRRFRVALRTMRVVQMAMVALGHKTDGTGAGLALLAEALAGGRDFDRYIRGLGRMVNARGRVEQTLQWLEQEPDAASDDNPFESDGDIFATSGRSEAEGAEAVNGAPPSLARSMGEWLARFWTDNIIDLEEAKLWDVWYMGSTPFPSEIINPSTRASIIAGLLNPHDFSTAAESNLNETSGQSQTRRIALWELPDTSILFRRYLEAGRMINVYDWYESFGQILETQKQHQRQAQKVHDGGSEADDQEHDDDVEAEAEDEEEWKMHVQARFMRALHELDYVGLVKHTGRKADHVMRTAFEALE
ncbi:uncharacterized protein STEHIDRAFT_55712, partial [Stereum hirsutum FP-91666 SS1]|uniref:uncharacterized protein n=1 Tax=Stereum hirsutum (strain FP-91666) TaxID=721885 RepID=UPI000440AADB